MTGPLRKAMGDERAADHGQKIGSVQHSDAGP